MTNEELVKLIQEGHQEHISQLWEQVYRFINMQAGKYLRHFSEFERENCVDDLVQDSYFSLLSAIEKYEDRGGSFLTYLDVRLRNGFRSIMGLRTSKQRNDLQKNAVRLDAPIAGEDENLSMAEILPSIETGFTEILEDDKWNQIRKKIKIAISALEEPRQEILVLTMLEKNCSAADAGRMLGYDQATTYGTFATAQKKLSKYIMRDKKRRKEFEIDDILSRGMRSVGLTSFNAGGQYISSTEAAAFKLIEIWEFEMKLKGLS